MRYRESSWLMAIDEGNQQLEWALWFRAAERIPLGAGDGGGVVPGPLDIDPLPAPSAGSTAGSAEQLREGWLHWWNTVLRRPRSGSSGDLFDPPGFEGLAGCPAFQRVVRARWSEANAWQAARRRAMQEQLMRGGAPALRESDAVRAVEAGLGRRVASFELRMFVLPVLDDRIRSVGDRTFLVPERVRATPGYDRWLRDFVSALA